MRNPNYLNKPVVGNTPTEYIKIDHIPDFSGMQDYDLNDEKELFKYFKDIEKVVRTSPEYSAMIRFLRANMNMNKCSFYKNVSNELTNKIRIHIHHEPFDLFSITQIVYKKRCAYRESLEVEMVAKEVMFLHYNMLVGLIPLAETPHELVHNKYLFIPINKVYGAYQTFVNLYQEFFDEAQLQTFNDLCDMTDQYNRCPDKEKENMSILSKGYLRLDIADWDIPVYEDVISSIRGRIDELKQQEEAAKMNNYGGQLK